MSKHTPGPWRQIGNLVGADGIAICRLCDGSTTDAPPLDIGSSIWDVQMKNARLMVAAPEMYTAIKEYLEWGPMTGSDRDLHVRSFRAAIAKAEGGTP